MITIQNPLTFTSSYPPKRLGAISDLLFFDIETTGLSGDYASGTNHTLPTGGCARAYSGVNIDSFLRRITYQELTREGLRVLAPTVAAMARPAENRRLSRRAGCPAWRPARPERPQQQRSDRRRERPSGRSPQNRFRPDQRDSGSDALLHSGSGSDQDRQRTGRLHGSHDPCGSRSARSSRCPGRWAPPRSQSAATALRSAASASCSLRRL